MPAKAGIQLLHAVWTPACALRDAHISEAPSGGDCLKILQAMSKGNWSGRFGGWIAVPAAEPRDNPGRPSQAVPGVRVLLQDGLAMVFGVEAIEHGDLGFAEGVAGRLAACSIARLDELQDHGCRLCGDGGKLDQPLGSDKLAVLDLQAVQL